MVAAATGGGATAVASTEAAGGSGGSLYGQGGRGSASFRPRSDRVPAAFRPRSGRVRPGWAASGVGRSWQCRVQPRTRCCDGARTGRRQARREGLWALAGVGGGARER